MSEEQLSRGSAGEREDFDALETVMQLHLFHISVQPVMSYVRSRVLTMLCVGTML